MATVVEISRLAELRSKTNRDLLRILDGEIERGLALGNVAASQRSAFYAQAEAVYRGTSALLAKITGLNSDDLSSLERKLKELRMALDLVPSAMDPAEEAICC
jgi:hypothetical protein